MNHDDVWRLHAACKDWPGASMDLFFPDDGHRETTQAARRICAACPVVADCLDYALVNHVRDGIWGGASERQRRSLARIARAHLGYRSGCECRYCASVTAHRKRLTTLAAATIQPELGDVEHGTTAAWSRGCRCRRCAFAVQAKTRRTA